MAKKILISVGGTGGHVFPAEALAEELSQEGFELLFVGANLSKNPYFNTHKFSYLEIEASSLSLNRHCFKNGCSILRGIMQSLKILKKQMPDVIIGFGSFHTLPLLIAAYLLKRPFYLHEQNVQLGKVNRLFAKHSIALASNYPKTLPDFPKKNKTVKMPLRFWKQKLPSKKEAHQNLFLDQNVTTILIFGGSQGASSLNRFFLESLPFLKEKTFQVIHLLGSLGDVEKTRQEYLKWGINAYVKDYEHNMLMLLKAADFIISRAGASSLSEQVELEIPSLLIPYPYASNHQEHNADYMELVVKGGIKLMEKDLNASLLAKLIQNFLSDEIRGEYIQNIKTYKEQRNIPSFADFIKKEIAVYDKK